MQILNYHNLYISQFYFNFPLAHMLHAIANILLHKLPNTNMYNTTLILPQVHTNIKNSPVFPILSKLYLFLLFSGLNFLSYFSLHAFFLYSVMLYDLQINSKLLYNSNTYTYFVQPCELFSKLVLVYMYEYW